MTEDSAPVKRSSNDGRTAEEDKTSRDPYSNRKSEENQGPSSSRTESNTAGAVQEAKTQTSLQPMAIDSENVVDETKAIIKTESDRKTHDSSNQSSNAQTKQKENEDYDFFDLRHTNIKKKSKRSRKGRTKLRISIPSMEPKGSKNSPSKKQEGPEITAESTAPWPTWEDRPTTTSEDWLEFFAETHEDQDPAFVLQQNQRREETLKRELAALDEKDAAARADIDKAVAELLKEKQDAMARSIESYRERIRQDERTHLARLQERYRERKSSNEQKINERVKQLQTQQQKQMAMALQQHRQQVQQRRLPDTLAAQEWQMKSQQVQNKHQQQRQELVQRAEEYKRRTEVEYKQEQEKIKQIQEQKLADLEAKTTSILTDLYKQFNVSRQRYVKRHLQRIMKEKEVLNSQLEEKTDSQDLPDASATTEEAKSPRDLAKIAVEHKQELRPPSPLKSVPDWMEKEPQSASAVGAPTRCKHRKGVLSSAQTHNQLSIEIHNEGIWILRLVNNKQSAKSTRKAATPISPRSPGANSTQSQINNTNSTEDAVTTASSGGETTTSVEPEFVPWGMRAFEFLESIVRGEIPMSKLGGGRRLDLGELAIMTQTSGQVFCSITDLRTSEETAQVQRAVALKEHEKSSLAELERKALELTTLTAENEIAVARVDKEEKQCNIAVDAATKDQEKAKKLTGEKQSSAPVCWRQSLTQSWSSKRTLVEDTGNILGQVSSVKSHYAPDV